MIPNTSISICSGVASDPQRIKPLEAVGLAALNYIHAPGQTKAAKIVDAIEKERKGVPTPNMTIGLWDNNPTVIEDFIYGMQDPQNLSRLRLNGGELALLVFQYDWVNDRMADGIALELAFLRGEITSERYREFLANPRHNDLLATGHYTQLLAMEQATGTTGEREGKGEMKEEAKKK